MKQLKHIIKILLNKIIYILVINLFIPIFFFFFFFFFFIFFFFNVFIILNLINFMIVKKHNNKK